MTGSAPLVYATGAAGQLLFAGRILVQWIRSERAGSPALAPVFWHLGLLGSIAVLAYGVMRSDVAIVVGQLLVYFVNVRNLHLMGRWASVKAPLRWATYLVPAASVACLTPYASASLPAILAHDEVPTWLVAWGLLGQLVFALRFVVQWIHSEAVKRSVLPATFWALGAVGAGMTASYAALRRDPVLLVGSVVGCAVYARNLVLSTRRRPGGPPRHIAC